MGIKQSMVNYIKNEKNDNIYTPDYAVYPLLKYLPKPPLKIWECCDFGGSRITYVLKENGYEVVSTDIVTGFDFLKDEPNFDFDMIVTNPPYSLKNDFLKKCYEYNKPFALLLPLTTLEGIERGKMFKENGINVIVLDKRINFVNQKKNNWFNTSWFIWEPNKENNKIIFEHLEK